MHAIKKRNSTLSLESCTDILWKNGRFQLKWSFSAKTNSQESQDRSNCLPNIDLSFSQNINYYTRSTVLQFQQVHFFTHDSDVSELLFPITWFSWKSAITFILKAAELDFMQISLQIHTYLKKLIHAIFRPQTTHFWRKLGWCCSLMPLSFGFVRLHWRRRFQKRREMPVEMLFCNNSLINHLTTRTNFWFSFTPHAGGDVHADCAYW